MDIHESRQGAVTVLKPVGPLVLTDADQFRLRVTEVMSRSLGRFVVDASGVPYVDSRGLEALVDATEELGRAGQTLRLCGATETVREVMDITDVGSLFEHYEDVTSAVRSFL
jgi:anti-sigma B factor antagonist